MTFDFLQLSYNNVSNKTTVALSIEVVLINTGIEKYHQVVEFIEKKYSADFLMCYDNPQYLRESLKHVYGRSFESVIEQIIMEIDDLKENTDIKAFLEKLQKENH